MLILTETENQDRIRLLNPLDIANLLYYTINGFRLIEFNQFMIYNIVNYIEEV